MATQLPASPPYIPALTVRSHPRNPGGGAPGQFRMILVPPCRLGLTQKPQQTPPLQLLPRRVRQKAAPAPPPDQVVDLLDKFLWQDYMRSGHCHASSIAGMCFGTPIASPTLRLRLPPRNTRCQQRRGPFSVKIRQPIPESSTGCEHPSHRSPCRRCLRRGASRRGG